MKTLIAIVVILTLFSCEQTSKTATDGWETIVIGDYVFDFPPDFKLVEEQGIDSYVGEIQGDSIRFGFDFGYYLSDFGQTTEEYLKDGFWKQHLPHRFMREGTTYDRINTPKVEILNIRTATIQDSIIGKGCDYVAKCKHVKTKFDFPIYIPEEIKQVYYAIDTIENQHRKMVWAKDPKKGRTGIYLKDLYTYNKSLNSSLALSMSTGSLTKEQQELVLKIFKTGRKKNVPE